MSDLSRNIDRSEIACKCGCGLDNIDPALIRDVQAIFDYVDPNGHYPIRSGCRCQKHNTSTPGHAEKSAHMPWKKEDGGDGLCHAIDTGCNDSHLRYKFLEANFLGGIRFLRIEIGEIRDKNGKIIDSWIHFDNRPDLPQEVIFLK